MRAWIGRSLLKLFGWRLEGEVPSTAKFVFIAAPHTSNWDLVFMLAAAWAMRVRIHWFGKHTLFAGPMGWVLRSFGGLPVDRRATRGTVAQAVELFERSDTLRLAVPPEGSRSHRGRWQSGFYHIARGAGVPVVTGFLDYATRRTGLGPTIRLSGDVAADMDRIRAFYEPMRGKYPQLQGPIRLREETVAEDAPAAPVAPVAF